MLLLRLALLFPSLLAAVFLTLGLLDLYPFDQNLSVLQNSSLPVRLGFTLIPVLSLLVLFIAVLISHRSLAVLKLNEERFRALFEASRDAILLLDDMHIIDCNPAALTLIGADNKTQLLGAHSADFIRLEPGETVTAEHKIQQLFQAALNNQVEYFVWPIRQLDGSPRTLEVQVSEVEIGGRRLIQTIARDITERQQVDFEMRELGQRFTAVMDTMNDGLCIVDSDTRLVEVNDLYCRLSGYSRDELLGMKVSEVDAIADDQAVYASFKVMQQQGGAVFKTRHRRKDGSTWPVAVSASYAPIKGGQYFSFMRDITAEENTQAELEQHRLHLEHLVEERSRELEQINRQLLDTYNAMDQVGIGIHWVNAENGRILYVNHQAAQMLGYSEAEILELAVPDIDPNFPNGDFQVITRELFQNGKAHFETTQKRKDGTLIPVEISGYLMPENSDHSSRFITFNTDISKRKAAEERNQQLLEILEKSPDLVSTAAIDGRIKYFNPAGLRLLGLSPDTDLETMYIPDFHPPEAAKQIKNTALPTTLSAGSWQGETLMLSQDGHEFPVLQTILVHQNSAGHPNYLSTIARDITQQKADEQALIDAKLASEAANLSKSAFLANMSHEIRTPLNGILGMADLIRRDGLQPQQRERMDTLESSSKHLLNIINAILDLSKIEAGKFELEQQPLQIETLVNNVAAMIEPRIHAKNLELVIELDDFPETLIGDATRLQQALLNYLGNALKFTEKGQIKLRVQRLQHDQDSLLIRFLVGDSGIGIADSALEKIFMAFEQADNTSTRQYGGTGLGLAITKKIAELMGGSAGDSSSPGQGSEFWFSARLPLGLAATPQQIDSTVNAESRLQQEFAGYRVLLAEDEPVNREIAIIQLEDVGLDVTAANDGQATVELAQQQRFDVILMDMQMPHLNGLEAAAKIRQIDGYADTPIIAMTANAFAEDRQKCYAAGMNDFIAKPASRDNLFRTLLTWLLRNSDSI